MSSLSQIRILNITEDLGVGTDQVATVNQLSSVGNTIGAQAFVEETNRLYIWNGQGWYNIALINATPTWDSNGQPAATYELSSDSPQTATTITLAASDPEGIPVSYNYITSGSMDSIATISQDSSVFTITPKTLAQAPDGGTGSITFRATDGINILPHVSSFTLNFISMTENSRYTTLLATAVDTSDNNNITDASSNNHSITVNGDTQAGTFSPYRSGGYSTKVAVNDGFTFADHTDFQFGTGEFTIDFWYKKTIDQSGFGVILRSSTGTFMLATYQNKISFHNGTNVQVQSATLDLGEWYHVAITRNSSNDVYIWLNGVPSTAWNAGTQNFNASGTWEFLHRDRFSESVTGEFFNFRIIKGTCLYTSNFSSSLPTERTVSVSGSGYSTSLLINDIMAIDDGPTAHSLTAVGSPKSIPTGPYDHDEYSATDHGGSVFIEANGGHLSGTLSSGGLGTTFTVEMWIYDDGTGGNTTYGGYFTTTDIGSQYGIQLRRYGAYIFNSTTGTNLTWNANGDPFVTIFGIGWHHVAAVHNGSTFKVYVDGKEVISTSDSHTYSSVNYKVGQPWLYQSDGSQQAKAYISDLRINKSVIYSGEFTPPTAPLSSTGSELHIKGTDASIIDKSQGTNLLIDGTTITGVSTGSKYSKAIKNTAASSAIKVCTPSEFNMRTNNDFTIEFWFKVDPTSSYSATNYPKYILQIQYGGIVFGIWANPSTTKIEGNGARTDGSSYITWSSSMFTSYTPNQWHHYALSFDKSNTTAKWFLDGSLYHTDTSYDDPSTSVTNSNGTYMVSLFGETGTVNSNTGFIGSIEDFRFSQFTRYTANFTPPTASLEG